MSEHLDLEKLPLEIDGTPVRETVREIFRNPANGTPDNISQAGCLALARKGQAVWNAWRGAFEVTGTSGSYRNVADFHDVDFDKERIDFSAFIFGDGANFQDARWGNEANFQGAQWGNHANFKGTQWGVGADFRGAIWGGGAKFRGAHWDELADFRGARWGVNADFQCAVWGDFANFECAQWDIGAQFECAQWGRGSVFRGAQWFGGAKFLGVLWGDGADFQGCQWPSLRHVFLTEEKWEHAQKWAEDHGISPDSFGFMDFSGAKFDGDVNFSNRKFTQKTFFGKLHPNVVRKRVRPDTTGTAVVLENDPDQRRHCIFAQAPVFHGCELHQNTSFEEAQFPCASGSEDAALAYRTLKLAFSKQQAVREEQRFFRLEMEEETLRETGLKRRLFKMYKSTSDYGFSVVLPLTYLLLIPFVLMSMLYGFCVEVHVLRLYQWVHDIPVSYLWDWLKWSFMSALPIPGIDMAKELRACLFGTGTGLGFLAYLIEAIHKTLSLAALFLIGLALRNLFKLK